MNQPLKPFKVTRVGDKIAVVLYSAKRIVLHQGFIQVADIERLTPLFKRYLKKNDVTAIINEIQEV